MASSFSGPGAIRVAAGVLELNGDRTAEQRRRIVILNTGDRPVQIGSHIHLPDVNAALRLRSDRGGRLPPRHPVRDVPPVRTGGVAGGRHRDARRPRRWCRGCRSGPRTAVRTKAAEMEIGRAEYAALYGPTVGDQVRLGDTDLWIEIEQDLTFGGEEAVFGGGKSIRESMAQGTTTRAEGALDTVITNAIVLDHWGIVRADVGIRDGRIVALGRSGNPDIAARCPPGSADRPVHGRHLGRRQDPDRGCHRHPRPLPIEVSAGRSPRRPASRPWVGVALGRPRGRRRPQ